jgi:hypothetical protein
MVMALTVAAGKSGTASRGSHTVVVAPVRTPCSKKAPSEPRTSGAICVLNTAHEPSFAISTMQDLGLKIRFAACFFFLKLRRSGWELVGSLGFGEAGEQGPDRREAESLGEAAKDCGLDDRHASDYNAHINLDDRG